MADDIKRIFAGKKAASPSDHAGQEDDHPDSQERQPIYKTEISLSSSQSDDDDDSVLEPSDLFSAIDQELKQEKQTNQMDDPEMNQESNGFVVVESTQVELE